MRNGLVEGVSLRAVLRESGAMAPEAAASVLAGMLVRLAVVHGDVRPEHVRVDGSGGLALTDFEGTDAQFVPNTPAYLAPERLNGAAPSAGADVFSATAVFFECLTNESPFVAATREDLSALHEYAEVIAEFAPPELRSVAQRGLAPDPARRAGSPHAFLDEVTATATAVYGADWQQRGHALLGGWAAAAARAAGVELVMPPGLDEAPPVGEPIDPALLGLQEAGAGTAAAAEPAAMPGPELAAVESDEAEEMPPPMGEPIDEALLSPDDGEVAGRSEASAPADGDGNYDWFTGGGKAESATAAASGTEGDLLAAFDGARAARSSEVEAESYPATGFDMFAGRSSGKAAGPENEEADSGQADDAGAKTDDVLGDAEPGPESKSADDDAPGEQAAEPEADAASDTLASEAAEPESGVAEPETADPDSGAAFDAFAGRSAEPEPARPEPGGTFDAFASRSGKATEAQPADNGTDSEPEPDSEAPTEDSGELLAAFDAFSPSTAEPEPEAAPEPEPQAVEPLPERDPFAGLQLETLAATQLIPESAAASSEPEEPEAPAAEKPESGSADEPVAEDPEPPEPEDATPPDLEDDWVIPATPTPKVPRSLSAFALSLPSLPRPQEEEPKPPVQTSAPDDWFRPGVPEPVGADAHHTQVLNPDRDNTLEREATRMLDEVPVAMAAGAAGVGAAAERARGAGRAGRGVIPEDDDFDEPGAPGGSGGPRRKTLVGVVTTAVLLVAGATAVVIGGSGKAPQGSGATPTATSPTSASATAAPTTPTGTSNGLGDSATAPGTPSTHHSSTHSRSHSSSSSPTSHSSTDDTSAHSSSSSPTDHSSSSTASTSTAPTSSTGSCIPIIVPCGPTSSPGGGNSTASTN